MVGITRIIFFLIFISSHLRIYSSSYPLPSSHLLIFSHVLIFLSSHLLIFASSHLHIFSHLLIFTFFHLHIFSLLPSCSLALLPSSLSVFYISLLRAGVVPTTRHAIHRNPFIRNEIRSAKIDMKLRIYTVRRNPFVRSEVRSAKAEIKFGQSVAALSHEMRFYRQKLR